MQAQFLLFKSKISKMGDRYAIYLPAGLKPSAELLHGLTGVVYFIPYTTMEKWNTICEVQFTKRAEQTRVKKIKCGDVELEINNIKVARDLTHYLPPRPDHLYDWKEIVLTLTRIGAERTIGEERGEHELNCEDRIYATWVASKIIMYIL